MAAVEALYVFDTATNSLVLQHWWRRQAVRIETLLPHYLNYPGSPPELIHIASTSPPTLLYNIKHNDLAFLAPVVAETEPLLVLEFLHRVVDVLVDYFSPPLVASKLENNYDTIIQILGEMVDDGNLANTEPNALRDIVNPPTLMGKLLGSVAGLPSSIPSLQPSPSSNLSAIPWRRSNVKHVNNELYVDLIEVIQGIFAPSGQPIRCWVTGTITVNSKLSGVPDLLLSLKVPNAALKQSSSFIEHPCFHPCVRLSKWNEEPGQLSFVPPDGKFVLATYEADILPSNPPSTGTGQIIPVAAEVRTSLGESKSEFEVVVTSSFVGSGSGGSPLFAGGSTPFMRHHSSRLGSSSPGISGGSSSSLEEITVTIPLPHSVKSLSNIRSSKGEYSYEPGGSITWKISGSALSSDPVATFKAEVITRTSQPDVESDQDEVKPAQDSASSTLNNMPHVVFLGFSIKGWLGSGLKVDGLKVVGRGLGDSVKPYKGVKYISKAEAIEIRC